MPPTCSRASNGWRDGAINDAFAEALVHVEGFPLRCDEATRFTIPTFYGRFGGYQVSDRREPLATTWVTRFLNSGGQEMRTDLLVWRDPGVEVLPFVCGTLPAPFPLDQRRIVFFDEEENPQPELDPAPMAFPWVSNRVRLGGASLPVGISYGWLYLDLNKKFVGPTIGQAHVTVLRNSAGRFQFGQSAVQLDNALSPLPGPGPSRMLRHSTALEGGQMP